MRGRVAIGAFVALLVLASAVALAQDEGSDNGVEDNSGVEGMPPFLAGDQEMPPGLANRDSLPPGLAKKLGDNTPPGQAKKDGEFVPPGQAKKEGEWTPPGLAAKGDGWLPPGLARQGKIPPGHAKRLGVEPTPDTDDED